MRNTRTLSIGRIVRYTDSDGQAHDAIVQAVVNRRVSIQFWPRFTPMALWVKPQSLSIPR